MFRLLSPDTHADCFNIKKKFQMSLDVFSKLLSYKKCISVGAYGVSEHECLNAELSLFVMIMVFQKEGYLKMMGVRSYGITDTDRALLLPVSLNNIYVFIMTIKLFRNNYFLCFEAISQVLAQLAKYLKGKC